MVDLLQTTDGRRPALSVVSSTDDGLRLVYARETVIYQRTRAFTATERSIAVLPFDNLSSDKENAYFAE